VVGSGSGVNFGSGAGSGVEGGVDGGLDGSVPIVGDLGLDGGASSLTFGGVYFLLELLLGLAGSLGRRERRDPPARAELVGGLGSILGCVWAWGGSLKPIPGR